jgi:hypothetical protein
LPIAEKSHERSVAALDQSMTLSVAETSI